MKAQRVDTLRLSLMQGLHRAIEKGLRRQVTQILQLHPERMNEKSADGDTPLHIAAWQNQVEMLRQLLTLGANVNARGDGGFSPLHYAARHGAVKSAGELIRAGADLNARDNFDFWPIHHALRGREPECVEVALLLEEANASLDLSCFVMQGNEAKVRQMIVGNPNAVDEGPLALDLIYDAVLWISCQTMESKSERQKNEIARRYVGLVEALLKAGADPNKWKWSGESALQLARTSHIPLLAQLLTERGAQP